MNQPITASGGAASGSAASATAATSPQVSANTMVAVTRPCPAAASTPISSIPANPTGNANAACTGRRG